MNATLPLGNRSALSVRELAESCGKHPTWCYRLLYSGKICAITQLGKILIPASELERVLNLAEPYNPKPKPKRRNDGGEA